VKNIKDFIGQSNVAIHCSNETEWNQIAKLLNRTSGSYPGCGNCFVIKVNGNHTQSKEILESQSYIIYPASDFLKKNILEICREKYPIGTKFHCAKDGALGVSVCEIQEDSAGNYYSKFLNTPSNQYVYAYNEWAKIILSETKYVKCIYDIGDNGSRYKNGKTYPLNKDNKPVPDSGIIFAYDLNHPEFKCYFIPCSRKEYIEQEEKIIYSNNYIDNYKEKFEFPIANGVIKKEILTELELPEPIKVIKRQESYY